MKASDGLLEALSEVTGTGSFCSTGHAPFFFPELEVGGLGEIAFPMVAAQVRELVGRAEKAPYGQGEKTVRDEAVRKCWQLDAAEFRFGAREWSKYLKRVVDQVREDLGIEGKVSAHPYKLLIYGKGGHFKAHRDTEKLDAMFGTLIVALPSAHEGGRLRVRHGGGETVVDFSDESRRHDFQHAAFFADCEHEVEPVKSGYRCCVVYNLRLDRGDPGALNRGVEEQAKRLAGPLAALREERAGELTAVLLEHGYTEANFALRNLKGHDATRARALLAAAKGAGFTAHLGLVTYHQMGELEADYGGGYGDDWEVDEENGAMGEIYEESRSIGHWRTAADRAVALGEYEIDEGEILSRAPLGEGDPDEREAEGYTGNAGCTMEYWYRRAAVVLWPAEDDEEVMCRYDFRGACRKLATLAKPGGKGERFRKLIAKVVERLPEELPGEGSHRYREPSADDPLRQVLEAVVRAGEPEWLEKLLGKVPDHAWMACDESLWDKSMRAFGAAPFVDLVGRLMAAGDESGRPVLFRLLAALAKHGDEAEVARVAAHLAGLDPLAAVGGSGGRSRRRKADPAELKALLVAVPLPPRVKDRRAVLKFARAGDSLEHVRGMLGPVLLEKSVRRVAAESGTVAAEALAFAIKSLADEVARPLEPFPDWRRPCPAGDDEGTAAPSWPYRRMGGDATTAEALRELRKFMGDPDARQGEFRYAEHVRGMLEDYIRRHQLDLDTTTNRKGRPYGLSCTKNDRSYHRALARRAEDEKLLVKLEGI
jgi:hypothetical protein